MKVFKEWWNEVNLTELPQFDNPPVQSCDFAEIGYEAGKKEALEEVLKQVDQSNSDGSIVDWIKKELGEEFKNHCHPKENAVLDGDRILCKKRCDEKTRNDCREKYNE